MPHYSLCAYLGRLQAPVVHALMLVGLVSLLPHHPTCRMETRLGPIDNSSRAHVHMVTKQDILLLISAGFSWWIVMNLTHWHSHMSLPVATSMFPSCPHSQTGSAVCPQNHCHNSTCYSYHTACVHTTIFGSCTTLYAVALAGRWAQSRNSLWCTHHLHAYKR